MPHPQPVARLSPGGIVRFLSLVTAVLVAVHLAFMTLRFAFGRDRVLGIARFFNLDSERSIPTWFGALLLAIAAALLGLCATHHARNRDPMRHRWGALAWLFALMSLDEVAGIHEFLGRALGAVTDLDRWTYFVWPIPAIALMAMLYLAYRPWFALLDRPTRHGVLAAAAIFLAGALGMELLGGAYWSRVGPHTMDLVYVGITTVEETLEMAGMLVFIHVLLRYAAARGWGLQFGVDTEPGVSRKVRPAGLE